MSSVSPKAEMYIRTLGMRLCQLQDELQDLITVAGRAPLIGPYRDTLQTTIDLAREMQRLLQLQGALALKQCANPLHILPAGERVLAIASTLGLEVHLSSLVTKIEFAKSLLPTMNWSSNPPAEQLFYIDNDAARMYASEAAEALTLLRERAIPVEEIRGRIRSHLYDHERTNPGEPEDLRHLLETLRFKDTDIVLAELHYLEQKGQIGLYIRDGERIPSTAQITARGRDQVELVDRSLNRLLGGTLIMGETGATEVMDMDPGPIEVFYSYSHKDEKFREKLDSHLGQLRNAGMIREWHDRKISAGTEWKTSIDAHLNAAAIILLLISADFLSSHYCYGVEMTRALERHESGGARVIPIILRDCDWHSAPFGKLQALPTDAKPISDRRWRNQDEAWADVARRLRVVIQELRQESGGQGTVQNQHSEPRPPEDSSKSKLVGNDAILFTKIYDHFKESGSLEAILHSESLADILQQRGIGAEEAEESVEMLDDLGLVKLDRLLGKSYLMRYTPSGFVNYCQHTDPDFQKSYNSIEEAAATSTGIDNHGIAETLHLSEFYVNGCLYRLSDLGLVKLTVVSGPTIFVSDVSVTLRRKYRKPS